MQLILDILLTALGLVTVGSYAVMGRGHFKSRSMPLGANLISLAALLSLAIYLGLLWSSEAPLLAQLAGLIIGALGLWLFYRTIAASRDRGLHFAFDPDNPVSLVTTGPYRVVRHPFYTSYLIFWVAMTVGAWSIWGIVVLGLLTAMYSFAARTEEAKFAATPMAADYTEYRKRAGMFWPKMG
jgi:protein-S-isoprenylcysteine O-methyltransferase Ste14